MKTVRLNIIVYVISAVCMYVIAALSLLIPEWVGARKSPFACDDYSIRNPLKKQTIGTAALIIITLVSSLVVIILTEIIIALVSVQDTVFKIRTFKIPALLVHIIAFEGYFQLGYVMQVIVNQVTKYAVGRLRPHFYTVCQPTNFTCGASGQLIYDYACTGNEKNIEEGRLSFYSGHSSMSLYTATFLIIYLHARIGHIAPRIVLSTVQTLLFTGGLFICYTRIADYYHHPSDVATGVVIGILGAIYTCYAWADLFYQREGYASVHGKLVEYTDSDGTPSSVKVNDLPSKWPQTTSDQALPPTSMQIYPPYQTTERL